MRPAAGGSTLSEYTLRVVEPSQVLQHHTEILNQASLKVNWDTTRFADHQYTLELVAVDSDELTSTDAVNLTIDNTPPTAQITEPRKGDQVGGNIRISGIATDANFESYLVEFGESPSPTTERGIAVESEGELLQWLPGDLTGVFSLRLTVTDKVDGRSTDTVTVNVLPPLVKEEGGRLASADGRATLKLSPRAVSRDVVITINPLPEGEMAAAPAAPGTTLLGHAFRFGPEDVKLVSHKPVTLSIGYDGIVPSPNKRLVIAHFNERPSPFRGGDGGGVWVPIGGTVNPEEKTVTTAVTQLGHYALMEMDVPEFQDSAAITGL